ncbi:proline--tRNA ligase [Candidatus Woesearchaeota archaeon B3_Woes]|nr:MAG: proline--tRNA ligase [Candidatus Woesearchaeota archaeon B3_Woes]
MKEEKGLTAKKEEDIAEWYEQVCLKAELAEFSKVKGCMIIRPNGYSIWEEIQNYFNKNIVDKTGTKNAYFPLFVPESFFKKEAKHAKGFSPEVAWLDKDITKDGERLAIRPTSETIMYDSYSRWVRSYRDLPLKINQWCNVVRWETEATKLFLRSREFLWQEGHCVYETKEECDKETKLIINLYKKLCEDLLALPVLVGNKTEKEKFAGAEYTLSIEAFMPDGKALQCGTSHQLGQGFAKSFGINFLGRDEKKHTPWQNSWGLSTRLIGGLVMAHSDDNGLVLPPKVAKNKLVIVPIIFEKTKDKVNKKAEEIKKSLAKFNPILDDREDYSPGWKYNEWELKGIPLRIEIGPKDLEKNQAVVVRRDTHEKENIKITNLAKKIPELLDDIQDNLFKKAKKFLNDNIIEIKNWDEFKQGIKSKKIVKTVWCNNIECEEDIKDKTGASTRCIPFDEKQVKGTCPHCKKQAKVLIYFSKSY